MCFHLERFADNFFSVIRHVWESKADGKFTVSEDTWNEPLGRGTEIRLHLRDDAGGYLEGSKLKVTNRIDKFGSKNLCLFVSLWLLMIINVYY